MKTCPKCQTKSQDSSLFCKKCGVKFSDSGFQAKRAKVLGETKGKSLWLFVSLIIVAVALGGTAYWLIQVNTGVNPGVSSQPRVAGKVEYAGQTIRMTDIPANVERGKISIPLEEVLKNRMVRFEYAANGVTVPLLSYVTPTGRVVTAVSMCEPCRSSRFHIQGKKLICNACYTEWTLDTLKGIQGGCLNYPPEVIQSTIENGRIQIDEEIVARWKPRV
jgi:uncharacterized Zn ribbon protein